MNDFFIDFITDILLLGLGALVSWYMIEDYQRKKDRNLIRDRLIDESSIVIEEYFAF